MKYDNIIFDFDGVLAESNEVKSDAFFNLYRIYGERIANKVVRHHELNGGMSRFEKFNFYHKNYLKKKFQKRRLISSLNSFQI